MNYYNEFDPRAAAWLRELIKEGLIPKGEIDERSISDVESNDLRGFRQCHFFAGIGGWSLALQLAHWPRDREVWTGSCPCQPFSVAGKRKGKADERHLWPVFVQLIQQCQPATVFGEQVASKAGREWLSGVRLDLEAMGYAVGAADLCAASVNAPHIRQRLWWVGHSKGNEQRRNSVPRQNRKGEQIRGSGCTCRLADPSNKRRAQNVEESGKREREGPHNASELQRATGRLEHSHCSGLGEQRQPLADAEEQPSSELPSEDSRMADTNESILSKQSPAGKQPIHQQGEGTNLWSSFDLIPCSDGKARRIEPGTFPLAHGIPGRVGLLRGYGNAIVPEAAKIFIEAFTEAEKEITHAE